MENEEDDIISNESSSYDSYMESYLTDTFGPAEEMKQSNPSGIEAYLNDKFPRVQQTIPERNIARDFAELKQQRRWN